LPTFLSCIPSYKSAASKNACVNSGAASALSRASTPFELFDRSQTLNLTRGALLSVLAGNRRSLACPNLIWI
jgi:hypothetical protein